MAKVEMPEKTSADRPLYFDEALRILPLQEFARRQHTFPHRRPRFHSSNTRSR